MAIVTRKRRLGEAQQPARYLGREIELPPDPEEPVEATALRDLLAILFLVIGTTIIVISTGVMWGFWTAALVLGVLCLLMGFVFAASS